MIHVATYRKKLLLSFAVIGATAAILFLPLPSSSHVWLLSAPLAILSNVGYGASLVALNAYIPMLAKTSEQVIEARSALTALADHPQPSEPLEEASADDSREGSEEPLFAHAAANGMSSDDRRAAKDAYEAVLSVITARISSQGIALGYTAGIAMLLLTFIPVRIMGGSTMSLRLAIGLSGVWWLLFSVPAWAWLPSVTKVEREEEINEGEWEQEGSTGVDSGVHWSTWREIKSAWKRLGAMLRWREIKRLKNTFIFLAAWFILSDGQYNAQTLPDHHYLIF